MTLFLAAFLDYFWNVVPWFLFGVVAAYVVESKFKPEDISNILGKFSLPRVLGAMLLGMVSPLSIMPQIPVSGSLVRLGAHPGLLLAFLAAERSYDFQSFPIIASFFGTRFATLNAIAIYASLLVAVAVIARTHVAFRHSDAKEVPTPKGFVRRQGKIFAVVLLGLTVAAGARVLIPAETFAAYAQTDIGGLVTAVVAGFVLYFGTILGNYPVAGAFSDLGMSAMGVMVFLTVSPIFNAVELALFSSAAHWKHVVRFFGAYMVAALVFSVLLGVFVL